MLQTKLWFGQITKIPIRGRAYTNSTNNIFSSGKPGEVPQPIINTLVFLDHLKSEKIISDVISDNLPNSLSDLYSKTS